ncbi:MAG TPA: hypothetical protein ENN67_02175, partial [Firmicutes bacterium]|nr:hypothetical protein [Bacillota bacterium]
MKRTMLVLVFGLFMFGMLACSQTSAPVLPDQTYQPDVSRELTYIPYDACGITETSLMVGQSNNLGTVTVSNNSGYLYFDVTLSDEAIADGWVITETHADVYTSLDGFPTTKKGNPKIGNFAYDINSEVPLDELWIVDFELYVAVHVALQRIVDGEIVQEETGWGNGEPFAQKGSWAMYFTHIIGDCCWVDVGLPSGQITARMSHPGAYSYWYTQLKNVPEGHDVKNGYYNGWCADITTTIYGNTDYQATLINSYSSVLPTWAQHGNWGQINWIINNDDAYG